MRDGRFLLAAAAASLVVGVVFVPAGGAARDGPQVIARVARLEGFAQDGDRVVWADTSVLDRAGPCAGLVKLRDLATGASTSLNRGGSATCSSGFQHGMALGGRRSLWALVSESLSSYHFDVQTSSPASGVRRLGSQHTDKRYGFVPVPMAGDGKTLVYANVSTTEFTHGYGYVHRADNSRIAGSYGTVALAADREIFAAARVDSGGCSCNADVTTRVSPDGRRVIFSSTYEDGFAGGEVYTLRVAATDGSRERVLSHTLGRGAEWAPDGKAILGATLTAVVLIDPETGNIRRLGTGLAPQFAPDGSRVAYLHPDGNYFTLQTVAVAGGAAHSLGTATGLVSWTADSAAVVYTRGDALLVGEAVTGSKRQLSLETVEPRLSPRGDFVAFRTQEKNVLTVVPLTGGPARALARGVGYFNWSPDGSRLSYGTAAFPPHLHVVNVDGSGDIEVGETPALAAWSPDGAKFAFARDVNTTAERTYVVAGRLPPRLVAPGTSQIWSPDSRSLLVYDATHQTLHVVEPNRDEVSLRYLDPIAWLPDSQHFIAQIQNGAKAGALAAVAASGADSIPITKPDAAPMWKGVELRATATGRIIGRAGTAGIPKAVAVDQHRVALLLRIGNRRVLELRRRPALRLERTLPIPSTVGAISLSGRWLVYTAAARIWAFDVTSGRRTSIAPTHGYVLDPTIEGTRVVWGEQRPNAPDLLLAMTLKR